MPEVTTSPLKVPEGAQGLVPQEEKAYAGVTVALSPVALVAHFTWNGLGKPSQEDLPDALRRRLRGLGIVAAEYGILVPVVGIVDVNEENSGASKGSDAAFPLKDAAALASNQEWHVGEFILYAEQGPEAVRSRWEDVLRPALPTIPAFTDLSREQMLESLGENRGLVEGWLSALQQGQTEGEQVAAIREAILAWARGPLDSSAPRAPAVAARPFPSPTEAVTATTAPLVTLKKLDVQGFRGCRKTRPELLNVNAEIVLVSAGNGRGKSSLLDAIVTALTGSVRVPDGPNDERSVDPRHVGNAGEESFAQIAIDTVDGTGADRTLIVRVGDAATEWSWTGTQARAVLTRPFTGTADPATNGATVWPGTAMHPDLQRRLTAYDPERVPSLFDNRARGPTLLAHLLPLPQEFEALYKALKDLGFGEEGDAELSEVRTELGEKYRRFADETVEGHREHIRALADHLRTSVSDLLSDAPADAEDARAAKDVWAALGEPDTLVADNARRIRSALDRLADALGRAKSGVVSPGASERARLAEIDVELDELRRDLQTLRQADDEGPLLFWAPTVPADWLERDERVPTPLERLIDDTARAHDSAAAARVGSREARHLVEELALVVPRRVAFLRAQADNLAERVWRSHARRRALVERVAALEAERTRLQEAAKDVRLEDTRRRVLDAILVGRPPLYGALDALGRVLAAPDRAQRAAELRIQIDRIDTDIRSRLRTLAQFLEERRGAGARTAIVKALSDALNTIFGRFATTTGTEPVRLDPIDDDPLEKLQMTLLEKLDADRLSTGTRSQLGVAWLVAQKLVSLSTNVPRVRRCPNRVLVLDDVSSSYDLSNLTREALLWRQLAFHPVPKERIQIVLASHHDSMTNRLYDLLSPPHGCRVVVHTITDWSLEDGATVESFQLPAAPAIAKKAHQAHAVNERRLARALEDILR